MGEAGGTFQLFYINIKKESFAGGGRGFNIYNIYIEISHRFQYIYYILKTSPPLPILFITGSRGGFVCIRGGRWGGG